MSVIIGGAPGGRLYSKSEMDARFLKTSGGDVVEDELFHVRLRAEGANDYQYGHSLSNMSNAIEDFGHVFGGVVIGDKKVVFSPYSYARDRVVTVSRSEQTTGGAGIPEDVVIAHMWTVGARPIVKSKMRSSLDTLGTSAFPFELHIGGIDPDDVVCGFVAGNTASGSRTPLYFPLQDDFDEGNDHGYVTVSAVDDSFTKVVFTYDSGDFSSFADCLSFETGANVSASGAEFYAGVRLRGNTGDYLKTARVDIGGVDPNELSLNGSRPLLRAGTVSGGPSAYRSGSGSYAPYPSSFAVAEDGHVYVEGHDQPIGFDVSSTASGISPSTNVDSPTYTNGFYITPGTWLVRHDASFATKNSATQCNIQSEIRFDTTLMSRVRNMRNGIYADMLTATWIGKVTSPTYVRGTMASSQSRTGCSSYLYALRIC